MGNRVGAPCVRVGINGTQAGEQMPNAVKIITDRETIAKMTRALWADEARRAGVAEADIPRSVFLRWRIEQCGGVMAAVYGLGRIRAMEAR